MIELVGGTANDPGWTPVLIATLAVAILAATPGVSAVVQNFLNRAKPILIGTWQLDTRNSVAELTVVNVGGAPALDVKVKVLGAGHRVEREDLSIRQLGFDDTVTIGAGRDVSRPSPPIVDVGKLAPQVQVEIKYRVPPHNRIKRSVFTYRWKTDVQ